MTKTMNEWDRQIAPFLRSLETYAKHLQSDSRGIHGAFLLLPCRPTWTTKAEEELEIAERELGVALALVKTMREQFKDKPEYVEFAQAAE